MSEDNGSVRYDAWMRRNPSHPGRHIRLGCMEDPDGKSMTVTEIRYRSDAVRPHLSPQHFSGHTPHDSIAACEPTRCWRSGWSRCGRALRQNMVRLQSRFAGLEHQFGEFRDRLAHLEGLCEAIAKGAAEDIKGSP